MINRRALAKFVAAGTVVLGAAGVAGCSIAQLNTAEQTAVNMIAAAATGWTKVAAFIGTIPGASAGILQTIGEGIATLNALATQAATSWATSGVSVLKNVLSVLGTLASAVAALGIAPPVVNTVLGLVPDAISFLEGLWVQLFPGTPAPTPVPSPASAPAAARFRATLSPTLSGDQIIAILNNPFAAVGAHR